MRARLSICTGAMLMIMVMANSVRVTSAGEPGRLAALAARQDLRDEVCIAMADGHISRESRAQILSDARSILKGDEYQAFRRSLDRLSPPPPPVKQVAAVQRLPKVAQKKSSAARSKTTSMAKSSPRPTMPADTIQPDRVAFLGGMR